MVYSNTVTLALGVTVPSFVKQKYYSTYLTGSYMYCWLVPGSVVVGDSYINELKS